MKDFRRSMLRLLDVDDLITMTHLAEGKTASEISRYLGLTAPAISHRFKKFISLFDKEPFFLEVKGTNKRVPSEYGMQVCRIAQKAVKVLADGDNPEV